MSQLGEDCYFFYYSTCNKGPACPFRHVEEARGSEVECPLWRQGRCFQPKCPYRHMELIKNRQVIPCYYESQPGGCTKPHCPFLHTQPKLTAPPPAFTMPPPVRPQVSGPQLVPQPTLGPPTMLTSGPPTTMPPVSGPPLIMQPVRPPGLGPPPPHLWRGPGPHAPPPFQPFPPGPRPGLFRPEQEGMRLVMVPKVEPVIVNVNSEESESDGSPMKPIRVVAPSIRKSQSDTSLIHPSEGPVSGVKEHNPLDYFLGAKPWIDPNPPQRDDRRSPSPSDRRFSQVRFQARRNESVSPARSRGSLSPARSRGSLSPVRNRRRSTSEERRVRPLDRRRSHSLDRSRSQSPDWRDRPRARSPVKPRSRSPVGRRPFRGPIGPRRSPPRRFVRSFQRPLERRPRHSPEKEKPAAQPVIVPTGPKIISTKKEKKEEEKKEETEKKETEEEKKEEESGDVPVTEVRSLEDIYREKALRSLMEAKKKKVIENRRKKLAERAMKAKSENPERFKSEDEKSDADKADKSQKDSSSEKEESAESESESSEDENEAGGEEGGAKAEEDRSEEEKGESDIDLPDDVDIELEAGEKGSEDGNDTGSDKSDGNDEDHSGSEEQKSDSSAEEKVAEKSKRPVKPGIKSRLGMKSDMQESKRAELERRREEAKVTVKDRLGLNAPKPSIKDRLGKREDITTDSSSVRSGVIRLNRARPRDIPDTSTGVKTKRLGNDFGRYGRDKDIMMLPKIVVRNRMEDFDQHYEHSRESSRSRHGFDSDSDFDHDSVSEDEIISKLTKRKKKLKRMLESEGSDFDEIELLKREKRKIKKLLKRKKERKDRRKREKRRRERKERDYSDEEDITNDEETHRRKIKIQSRLGPAKQESDKSEEEAVKEEEEKLSSEEEIELEEVEKNGEEQVEVKEELNEEQIKVQDRLRLEKAQKLVEALQPKTLEDIRRERAMKKVLEPRGIYEEKEKKLEGSGRRILLAEDKEPSSPKQQVRITFNEEPKPPVRQRIRLKRDTEQNENSVPATNTIKTFKRERQIYLPPGRKRTDEPDSEGGTKRPGSSLTEREVVDYGDMFPSKKPKPAEELVVKVPTATTVQLNRQERRPPKVEVENAGIKSFAEIMAEKKRKRLLAQQESKKNITPIVFEDKPDSGLSVTSKLTPDLRSRLSQVDDSTYSEEKSQSDFSGLARPLQISRTLDARSSATGTKTDSVGSVRTDSNSQSSPVRTSSPVTNLASIRRTIPSDSVPKELSTQKPTRWKRRKASTGINEEANVSVSSSGESLTARTSESASDILKLEENVSSSPVTSGKERRASAEKKSAKVSDSLMDFDDELLGDIDLELDDEKSHDELMREMEELLA